MLSAYNNWIDAKNHGSRKHLTILTGTRKFDITSGISHLHPKKNDTK